MDRLAPQLAGERLAAFAEGVRAREKGLSTLANPYLGSLLRASQVREWEDGWLWQDKAQPIGARNET